MSTGFSIASRAIGAVLVLVAGLLAASAVAGEPSGTLTAPFAGGNSAANMTHKTGSTWVLTRWVARRTGVLSTLYLRVKTEGSVPCFGRGRAGYAAGTTGEALVTTHPVQADGRPDLGVTLGSDRFNPCARAGLAESAAIRLDLPVVAGAEYATIVRNVDSSPGTNWFSSNFLYTSSPLAGANGRNERDAAATDVFYGLDPRELVGYSSDGGASWRLPGGQYSGGFLPTYIQAYADGYRDGQPYYWAEAVSGVQSTVFPNVPSPWTITHLGLYARASGTTTLTLLIDGVEVGSAIVTGSGMLRAPIAPVTAPAGSTVVVRTSGGITLSRLHADGAWRSVLGLGPTFRWYDASNPTGDAAVTVYALPWFGGGSSGTSTTTTGTTTTTTTTTTMSTTTTTTTTTTPPGHCKKRPRPGC
jgi:hypothetical protein